MRLWELYKSKKLHYGSGSLLIDYFGKKFGESFVLKTVKGAIASFSDSIGKPAVSVVCDIEPIQSGSGTPSPDNVRPISGWTGAEVNVCGKNLLDVSHAVNSAYTNSIATALAHYKNTGEYATGYTSNGVSLTNNNIYMTSFTPIKSGAEYVIKNTTSGSNLANVCFLDDDGNVISRNIGWSNQEYVHTALANEKYIMCSMKVDEKGAVIIALGDTVPAYEPYQGHTYSVSWSEHGTIYGGTVDVVSGVVTVEYAQVTFNGSESWAKTNAGAYYLNMSGYDESNAITCMCNMFTPQANVQGASAVNDNSCCFLRGDAQKRFYIRYDAEATLTDFTTFLTNNTVQLVYKLATPLTYQLTPQQINLLKGTNNVWCNTGDVEAVYKAQA